MITPVVCITRPFSFVIRKNKIISFQEHSCATVTNCISKEALTDMSSARLIDVTYIIDPQHFYVRPRAYRKFIKEVEASIPTHKVKLLRLNELVVYNCGFLSGYKMYLRGLVTKIGTAKDYIECDLMAIDYGFTIMSIPIDHIWCSNKFFRSIPPLSYACMHFACFPIPTIHRRGFSPESVNFFKQHAQDATKLIVIGIQDDKRVVNLMKSNMEVIGYLMATQGYSFTAPYNDPLGWKPVAPRGVDYTYKQIEVNQTFRVRMQSGTSLKEFHVTTINDYNYYLKELMFYANWEFHDFSELDVHRGALVNIKDEQNGLYERGFIKALHLAHKTALILLVDSGKERIVPVTKLKYLPTMCLQIPVSTIFCSTESTFWEDNNETFLKPGYEFIITIKKLGYKFVQPNIVDIYPINDECEGAVALLDET